MSGTQTLLLLTVALASARIAVLLAHDFILESARHWFFLRYPPVDNVMLGMDYQSRDREGRNLPAGAKRDHNFFGELLTCTRCLTVWVSPPVYAAAVTSHYGLIAVQLIAVMFLAAWGAKKL